MSLFEVNVGRATKGLVGQAAGRRGREGLGRRQLPCVFHPEALCAYLPPGVEFFGGGSKPPGTSRCVSCVSLEGPRAREDRRSAYTYKNILHTHTNQNQQTNKQTNRDTLHKQTDTHSTHTHTETYIDTKTHVHTHKTLIYRHKNTCSSLKCLFNY